MISFRFHVVSLTAVFLAIAVGVIVGTTYVDRAVVENLENRIDTVSENLDERRAQIGALEEQLGDLRAYSSASADFAVTSRLPGQPVALLALRGVDDGPAEQLATLLRRAGANTPGVIWMEPAWALEDDEERTRLADVLGVGTRSADALRAQGLRALATALAPPSDPADLDAGAPVLDALVEGGFLAVDDLGDGSVPLAALAGSGARVLLLTGTEAEDVLRDVPEEVVAASTVAGLPTVVAHAFAERDDGPRRGEEVWSGLPEELREQVVVVDDADLPEGRVAAVLGVAEVAAGRTGRFGHGSGADGVLPAWSAP